MLPMAVAIVALALSAGTWVLRLEAAQRGASEAARIGITDPDSAAITAGEKASGGLTTTLVRRDGYVTACIEVTQAPWPATTRCATAAEQR